MVLFVSYKNMLGLLCGFPLWRDDVMNYSSSDRKQRPVDLEPCLILASFFSMLTSSFWPLQEISGMPTSLKKESSQRAASPDAMGESSSSGTARLDKPDSFRVL